MEMTTTTPPTQPFEHYVDASVAADFIGMKPHAALQLAFLKLLLGEKRRCSRGELNGAKTATAHIQ
jgi:hypothetical protein